MKRIDVPGVPSGALTSEAINMMMPRRAGGLLVGHPAMLRLVHAAQGQPLHPDHRRKLSSFGASRRQIDHLDLLIADTRRNP